VCPNTPWQSLPQGLRRRDPFAGKCRRPAIYLPGSTRPVQLDGSILSRPAPLTSPLTAAHRASTLTFESLRRALSKVSQ